MKIFLLTVLQIVLSTLFVVSGYNVRIVNNSGLLDELESKLIDLSSRSQNKVRSLNGTEADDNSTNNGEGDKDMPDVVNLQAILASFETFTDTQHQDYKNKLTELNHELQELLSSNQGNVTCPNNTITDEISSNGTSAPDDTYSNGTSAPDDTYSNGTSAPDDTSSNGTATPEQVTEASNTTPTTVTPVTQSNPVFTYEVHLTGDQGVIESQNFPRNYSDNLKQVWYINGPSDKVIRLHFEFFDVWDAKVYGGECFIYDLLTIEDGEPLDAERLFPNCKPMPNELILASNAAKISFETNGARTGKGFRINFDMVDLTQNEGDTSPATTAISITTPIPSTTTTSHGLNSPTCGRLGPGRRAKRIMGGTQEAYQTGQNIFKCGASLLSNRWLVTAANCLEIERAKYIEASNIRLFFGEHNLKNHEQPQHSMRVEKVIVHPNRRETYGGSPHDIVLIKTSSEVPLNDHVNTICLDETGETSTPGSTCIVTGWGTDSSFGRPDVLQELEVNITSNSKCKDIYGSVIQDNMVCATHQKKVASPCEGDSGGPLACSANEKYYLTGILSFGHPCGLYDDLIAPSVYGRVSYYADWIKGTIENN